MRVRLGRSKNTIVGIVAFDGNTNISSPAFQLQFAIDGVTSSSGKLVVNKQECTVLVHIDGTTGVSILR